MNQAYTEDSSASKKSGITCDSIRNWERSIKKIYAGKQTILQARVKGAFESGLSMAEIFKRVGMNPNNEDDLYNWKEWTQKQGPLNWNKETIASTADDYVKEMAWQKNRSVKTEL